MIRDLAAEGWTLVIVTHEIRFAQQVADQVLFIEAEVILERVRPRRSSWNPTRRGPDSSCSGSSTRCRRA